MTEKDLIAALVNCNALAYLEALNETESHVAMLEKLIARTPPITIAKEYGITADGVRDIARRVLGRVEDYFSMKTDILSNNLLETTYYNQCSERTKAIVTLFSSGKTYKEICDKFGCTTGVLIKTIKMFIREAHKDHESIRRSNEAIGAYIKEQRMKLGLSLTEFAERLGRSERAVKRLEAGQFRELYSDWLVDLADIFSVSIDTLMLRHLLPKDAEKMP